MRFPIFILAFVLGSLSGRVTAEIHQASNVEELQATLDKAFPDDIIHLEPGKYVLDQPLEFKRGGLGSQPITLLALEKGRTVFTGTQGFVLADVTSVTLKNLIFFAIQEQPVLRLNASRNIVVQGCEFHKCGKLVEQDEVEEPRVPPFYMEACLARLCVSGGILIDLKAGYNRLINNSFESCGGTIRLHGDRNLIRGNYFMGSAPSGLALQFLGNKDKFINQYFHQVQAPAGRKAVVDVGRVRQSIFGHTTWYGCSSPVFYIGEEGKLSAMNTFANNLVQNHEAETPPLVEAAAGVVDLMWANNLLYDPAGRKDLVKGITMEFLGVDPQLFETNGVWRLTAESPAMDAGTGRTGSSMMDIEGRVRGLRPDIGAHEVSKEEATLPRVQSVFFK